MAYTINNMNNRFDIKRKGYLKSLQDLGQGAYNNCIQKLSKGSDKDYAYFSCDMKNRINSYMKNIRGEFDLNYKEGNYLNLDSDNYDEDDFHISENDTLMIRRLRDATVLKFLTLLKKEEPRVFESFLYSTRNSAVFKYTMISAAY